MPGMCRCSGTGDGGRLDPGIEIVDSIQVRARVITSRRIDNLLLLCVCLATHVF